MNAGGAVLVLAGVWVLCQVLGGDALNRLGLTGKAGAGSSGSEFPNVPDRGYSGVPHDAWGRPL